MVRAPSALYQRRKPCRNHLKGQSTHKHTHTQTVNRQNNTKSEPCNIQRCEKHYSSFIACFNSHISSSSSFPGSCHVDGRRQAAEHGRRPHPRVPPGQRQRRQPRPPGAAEDQQAVVPQLSAPRASPQTLRRAGIQRGRRSQAGPTRAPRASFISGEALRQSETACCPPLFQILFTR